MTHNRVYSQAFVFSLNKIKIKHRLSNLHSKDSVSIKSPLKAIEI